MINVTVSGRIGKDAETREAGQTQATSFSVASSSKMKGEDVTTWTDCTIWGTRGEKLAPYLKKGGFVVVSGTLTTREHNSKTYLQVNVSEIDLGPKTQTGQQQQPQSKPAEDDPLPF